MFLRKLYRLWCVFWFILVFLLLFPFFVLFIQKKSWHKHGHFLNKIWAHIVFNAVFLPRDIEYRFRPQKNKAYVYCANHASYFDIPCLAYVLEGHFLFIGKASLMKVPLFGYMFRGLYIAVDRESKMSKYKTMVQCAEALSNNISIAIFPEGTIPRTNTPQLIPFKEGAFRVAIEKQIPIVPVTFPYNWIILPDDGKFLPKRHLMKVIVHDAIETKGMTIDDIEALKEKTFNVIDKEIRKYNKI
ncbi:MAG: 1-acyl-sn-glycerol-3-phosphate acyltransferase [Cytophagaceae bacterium]|nr:1-acyl-sn-glycerol-3-phosphate acyltransferase [Cytophagaceae bacterium]